MQDILLTPRKERKIIGFSLGFVDIFSVSIFASFLGSSDLATAAPFPGKKKM